MIKRALSVSAFVLLASATALTAQATPRSAGARAAGAAPAAASVLGKWEFTIESPQGTNVMNVTFSRVDGALAGMAESQMGQMAIADVTQTGSDLAFVMRFEANGQSFDIPFTGKVTGEAAEGSLSFSMGDTAPQSIPWKAKKVP